MTTIEPAGPGGWPHRAAMWLGHHEARINMGAFAFMGATVSTAIFLNDVTDHTWVFVLAGTFGMLVAAVAVQCDVVVHRRHLCPLDVDRVPWMDPEVEVTRRAHLLREYHLVRRRMTVLMGSVALMVAGLLAGGWARDRGVPMAALIAAVPYCFLMYIQIRNVYVSDIHDRLQRWCPLCPWGRGAKPERDRTDF